MLNSITNLRVPMALCGAVLAAGVFACSAQADQWDKKTILTVNEPIQVQERLLEPGTYVFKLLESSSNRHIVQIFNRDQSHIIDTVIAIPNYRLQPTGHSQFSFYETPAGTAKALHAWFYPGDNFGQEFRYPKHSIVLQASASMTTTAPAVRSTDETVTTETTVTTTPMTTDNSASERAQADLNSDEANRADRVVEESAEVAAPPDTPAPPPATTEAPVPAPQSMPSSLPKTGSVYPLIGMAGLLSLGLYSLVRRSA